MLTKDDILLQLQSFEIAKGRPVLVHSSMKAIGKIEGGAETLLSALIDFFAANGGVLCIPAHTWNRDVMNMKDTYTCVGVLPSIAIAHPDGIRSPHPTHSMMVFGDRKRCERFVENEKNVDVPASPEGCYGNIYKEDGYVLLIGVGHDKNTFLHCAEEMLRVPERLTKHKVDKSIVYEDGRIEKRSIHWFYEEKIPDVSVNYVKYEPAFRRHGCITDGYIGNAQSQLCSVRKMTDVMKLINKNSEGRELLADKSPLDEKLYK